MLDIFKVPTQDEVRESDFPKGIERSELELVYSTRKRVLSQTSRDQGNCKVILKPRPRGMLRRDSSFCTDLLLRIFWYGNVLQNHLVRNKENRVLLHK